MAEFGEQPPILGKDQMTRVEAAEAQQVAIKEEAAGQALHGNPSEMMALQMQS